MSATPPSRSSPRGRPGASEEHLGDRPTPVPDFDPEAFARDSEIKLRTSLAVEGEPTIDQARRLHLDGDQEHALFLLTRLLERAPLNPEGRRVPGGP